MMGSNNTQQNSHPNQNIQDSHNQQTKQNQKQLCETQGHINKFDGNPHNRITRGNYDRRKETHITVSSRILNHTNCTSEDDQFGRNMYCPIKKYKERMANVAAHSTKATKSDFYIATGC
jgi:TolA-binding protein